MYSGMYCAMLYMEHWTGLKRIWRRLPSIVMSCPHSVMTISSSGLLLKHDHHFSVCGWCELRPATACYRSGQKWQRAASVRPVRALWRQNWLHSQQVWIALTSQSERRTSRSHTGSTFDHCQQSALCQSATNSADESRWNEVKRHLTRMFLRRKKTL